MSLEQAVEQGDIEIILDNAELALEEKESTIYTDPAIRQKVVELALNCATDNGHLSMLKRIFDFFVGLKSVNLLDTNINYHRLRVGLLYKRTSLPNKKKEIISNFLQFLDEQEPQLDVLEYQPFIPIHNLLDPSVPEDQAFIDVLKQYVADQTEEVQVHYLSSLAPPYLVDSLKVPCQLLAEKLTFLNGTRRKFTIMVMGKTGQGKSCLVNELHRLSEEQRCAEFAGKSTGTVALESKAVVYRRPPKPEEEAPAVVPPSPSPSSPVTTSTLSTPTPNAPTNPPAPTTSTTPDLSEKTSGEEDTPAGETVEVEIEIIDTPGIEAKSERQEQVQGEIFERLSEGFVEGG
eukprot:Phypoly_transcript_04751.p1 GENE.Phypoly_transcript_04751~~Phypoly_transcript_04751.p1  ORF type:complete len:358 (+),score=70.73 Phypoly_transcript_04751:36-1076(+)